MLHLSALTDKCVTTLPKTLPLLNKVVLFNP